MASSKGDVMLRLRWGLVVTLVGVACAVGASPSSFPASSAAVTGGEWRREPGGSLSAVAVNAAGMIYVTGSIWAPRSELDDVRRLNAMVVAKYGPAGKLLWRRTWRRGGLWFARGLAVAPAPAGGVYVAGVSGRYEGWAPVLWRYSASGRPIWRRTLPAPLGRGGMASIATDDQGVVAAVNNADTGGPTAGGAYIYSFDHAGGLVWRTEFAVPGITGTSIGVSGVAIGQHGLMYAVGFVDRAPLDARNQDWDVVVQQLTRGGRVRWTRVLGDPGVRDIDHALAVATRPGLVVVSGSQDDWARGALWAFTPAGERLWTRRWGKDKSIYAPVVTIAPWGSVYVAADRQVRGPGTGSLRRYRPDGTFVSKRAADDWVSGVAASDAIYIVAGRALERWIR
jgi:hypothetical protein